MLKSLKERVNLQLSLNLYADLCEMIFFFSKKSLARTGMFISESLTKRRLYLLKESQKNFGVRNTWSMKGDIYVSIDGNKHKITSHKDIENLL